MNEQKIGQLLNDIDSTIHSRVLTERNSKFAKGFTVGALEVKQKVAKQLSKEQEPEKRYSTFIVDNETKEIFWNGKKIGKDTQYIGIQDKYLLITDPLAAKWVRKQIVENTSKQEFSVPGASPLYRTSRNIYPWTEGVEQWENKHTN